MDLRLWANAGRRDLIGETVLEPSDLGEWFYTETSLDEPFYSVGRAAYTAKFFLHSIQEQVSSPR